jgi:tRNA 2-thiouridine synthesizing protein D
MSDQGKSFSLLITSPPWSSQGHISALNFAKSLIKLNHSIYRVFFYGDATFAGNALTISPQDEMDIPSAWSELAEEHNIDLVICISAGIKRGILDETEQSRYEKPANSLIKPFELSGLGQLVDAIIHSDRVISF